MMSAIQRCMNHPITVLASIVNYRTPQDVLACLESLATERSSTLDLSAVVVDNASEDESLEIIRRAISQRGWSNWVGVVPLAENGGYSAGHNAVLGVSLHSSDPADYYLLLNPDTQFRPGALFAMVVFMVAHPEVGLVGPRLESPDGTPHHSAFRFPTILNEFEIGLRVAGVSRLIAGREAVLPLSDQAQQVGWVAGACMLVRRSVLEDIGLMDSTFFLYYEEVDFCLRAAQQGWPCWIVPDSHVVHLQAQSMGRRFGDLRSTPLPPPWFTSRRHYFRIHHSPLYAILADLARISGTVLSYLRTVVGRTPPDDPPYYLRDLIRSSLNVTTPPHD